MLRAVERRPVQFAVVDVETTGFSPWLNDRVLEVAVVRMNPTAGIIDEYVTLVNPDRDVGPTNIHGIRAADIRNAPTWADIAGDVGHRIQDAVMAAHNLRFDRGFLVSEYARVGVQCPNPFPGVCTLALSGRLFPELDSHKLRHCCAHAGIEPDDEHSALTDARATAHLLAALLAAGRESGRHTLGALGCEHTTVGEPWCHLQPSGKSLQRPPRKVTRERSYLARLIERLPPTPFTDPDQGAYLDLLDRALQDRRVTTEEEEALRKTASEWGLTRAAVFEAHHKYLAAMVAAATNDDVITADELEDLEHVCALLGLDRSALDVVLRSAHDRIAKRLADQLTRSIVATPQQPATATATKTAGEAPDLPKGLSGLSVCFTGTFVGVLNGVMVTREQVEQIATERGFQVRSGVSKKLDLLVAADPDTLSGKAKRARALGLRVIEEADFWAAINLPVVLPRRGSRPAK